MASASVHFPDSLLEDLDHLASERGVSRNRLIVEACHETLRKLREWPTGFFDDARFCPEDLEDLRASAKGFETNLAASRCNRDVPPL